MSFELSQLAKYGVIGVCIALVALIGFIIREFMDVIKNHIQHNTEAILNNIKSQEELTGTIKELKNFLLMQNKHK